MTVYTRKQVIEEAEKLAKMLAKTEQIERFKELEVKINENQKVQDSISKIKSLQKQAVNFQHYGKEEALKVIEKEIDRLQDELDGIPVVQEFKDIQVHINDVLQLITSTISRELTNEIIRDTGGDLLSGETGSKVRNSSISSHH
ncbi:YlbF family regulator [Bacillaceae bacterium S4-13-56]